MHDTYFPHFVWSISMRSGCFHFGNNLSFVDAGWLVIYRVDDFEFEGFGIVLVCHVVGDDALEQVFVYASGGNMVDDSFHALHEVVGVPIIAVMHKELYTNRQGNSFVGILEIMTGA